MQAGTLRSTVITRFPATTAPSDSCRRFRIGRSPKFPCRTFGTRHVPMPRPVGRVAKRLRRVRVGFRYHDTLGHGRPFGWKFRGVHTGLHFRLAHSFVQLGFCASVAHPLARPSGRLRRGSLRKAFAFLRCISAQPAFLSACRFLCRTDSFHSVSSAELCLAHHGYSFLSSENSRIRHGAAKMATSPGSSQKKFAYEPASARDPSLRTSLTPGANVAVNSVSSFGSRLSTTR